MAYETIEIEADSIQEINELRKSRIPEGVHILSEKIISDGKLNTVETIAETIELAYAKANEVIPTGSIVNEQKILIEPTVLEAITIEAINEHDARIEVKNKIGNTQIVKSLDLVVAGKKGFLGIGKKPNTYRAEIFQPAVLESNYKEKAKVSVTFGEKKASNKSQSEPLSVDEALVFVQRTTEEKLDGESIDPETVEVTFRVLEGKNIHTIRNSETNEIALLPAIIMALATFPARSLIITFDEKETLSFFTKPLFTESGPTGDDFVLEFGKSLELIAIDTDINEIADILEDPKNIPIMDLDSFRRLFNLAIDSSTENSLFMEGVKSVGFSVITNEDYVSSVTGGLSMISQHLLLEWRYNIIS